MGLRSQLFRVYGALRDVIAPGLLYSQRIYELRLSEVTRSDIEWLDLGCGHQVLPAWRAEQEARLVSNCRSITGIDYDMSALQRHRSVRRRVRGDISSLPFRDSSFDLITANMVVEHLGDPETQFREIARALRPGGILIVHTPNANSYPVILSRATPEAVKGTLIRLLDSRKAEDVFPTHYRANTDRALEAVAARAGLRVVRMQMVATDAVSALIAPLAAIELAVIRLTLRKGLRRYRADIIATLQKPALSIGTKNPVSRIAAS
jgi:ubiquinone/menaquinone biosynthesis C-methylase UbiE